jgi:hypothetical protein
MSLFAADASSHCNKIDLNQAWICAMAAVSLSARNAAQAVLRHWFTL